MDNIKGENYEQNEVNHAKAIDLGLPSGTKWANCNVGATKPEECGEYFAWGETEEKEVYTDVTYKYSTGEDTDGDGTYNKDKKYQDLGESICGTEYDVARMRWGDEWQMPTSEQIKELLDNCKSEWTELNGMEGCKFTGPNGNSIFFPANGNRYLSGLYFRGYFGYYWSGTVNPDFGYNGVYHLYIDSSGACQYKHWYRYHGSCVRPVKK